MPRQRERRRNQVKHRLQPNTEGLEDRLLLYATLGGNWTYGSRITYSFAPDGTSIGGISSGWYARMSNLSISEQAWKDEFREAADVWSAVAGINLVEVSDNGAAFSVAGNQQNDSRFGDIRIGGTNQGTGVLGGTFLPPPYNGGTLAGDIVMNTAAAWKVDSTYDIQTVAIHEFGHALGMDHSSISTADMYAYYNGTKQSLATDDTNGIRSIYGPRQPDAYDAAQSNDYWWYASNVTSAIDVNKQVRLGGLDITTNGDYDWYYVYAPTGTASRMTVQVQSSGLSSLSPELFVLNSSLQTVGYDTRPSSYGATASATVQGVSANQLYLIRVSGANGGVSDTGTYGLLINFGSGSIAPIAPPNTTVPEQPNSNGGGSSNLATEGPNRPSWLTKILAHTSPKVRGLFDRLESAVDEGVGMLQIGDLSGFGHYLMADAGTEFETAEPIGTAFAAPRSSVAAESGIVIGMVGTDQPIESGTFASRRDRLAHRAIDRVLAAWGAA